MVQCGESPFGRWPGPHRCYAELAPYVTLGKGLGCYHFLATTGYKFAAGSDNDASQMIYANAHRDRQCFGWLYPLVEVNTSWHTSNISINQPLIRDFFDLNNFEASGDIVTLAVGYDAVLKRDRLELGAVYATPLYTQHGFNFSGLLVGMTMRF